MRETKFRGKRIDNGEWVYGYYVCYGGAIPKATHHIIHGPDNLSRLVGENFEVIPETVGQYTGLKDSKRTEEYPDGQPICEGDIVQVVSCGDKFIGKVYYEDAQWFGASDYLWCAVEHGKAEVIGNIYDNLDLLGVD